MTGSGEAAALRDAFRAGRNDDVRSAAEAMLERSRHTGDVATAHTARAALTRLAIREGDLAGALEHVDEALAAARGEPARQELLHIRAACLRLLDRLEEAARAYRDCIALDRQLRDPRMALVDQHNLAFVELRLGNTAAAERLFREVHAAADGTDVLGATPALARAAVALALGDRHSAAAWLADFEHQHATRSTVPDPDDARELELVRANLASGT